MSAHVSTDPCCDKRQQSTVNSQQSTWCQVTSCHGSHRGAVTNNHQRGGGRRRKRKENVTIPKPCRRVQSITYQRFLVDFIMISWYNNIIIIIIIVIISCCPSKRSCLLTEFEFEILDEAHDKLTNPCVTVHALEKVTSLSKSKLYSHYIACDSQSDEWDLLTPCMGQLYRNGQDNLVTHPIKGNFNTWCLPELTVTYRST